MGEIAEAKPIRWDKKSQMLGDFMTCMEMCGNGVWIGGIHIKHFVAKL